MISQLTKAALVAAVFFSASAITPAMAEYISSSVKADSVTAKKRTSLGLYITAKDAFAHLEKNKKTVLIDVRTPEETMFVGIAKQADINIPLMLTDTSKYVAKKKRFGMKPNPHFSAQVDTYLKAAGVDEFTPVIFMCRSGSRSSKAVSKISELGYDVAYTVIDGFEGDKDKKGQRTVNGWKNADLPWSYKLSSKQAYKAAQTATH